MLLPLLAVLILSVASQGRESLLFPLSATVLDISRLETSYYLFRGAVGEIIILLFPVCLRAGFLLHSYQPGLEAGVTARKLKLRLDIET